MEKSRQKSRQKSESPRQEASTTSLIHVWIKNNPTRKKTPGTSANADPKHKISAKSGSSALPDPKQKISAKRGPSPPDPKQKISKKSGHSQPDPKQKISKKSGPSLPDQEQKISAKSGPSLPDQKQKISAKSGPSLPQTSASVSSKAVMDEDIHSGEALKTTVAQQKSVRDAMVTFDTTSKLSATSDNVDPKSKINTKGGPSLPDPEQKISAKSGPSLPDQKQKISEKSGSSLPDEKQKISAKSGPSLQQTRASVSSKAVKSGNKESAEPFKISVTLNKSVIPLFKAVGNALTGLKPSDLSPSTSDNVDPKHRISKKSGPSLPDYQQKISAKSGPSLPQTSASVSTKTIKAADIHSGEALKNSVTQPISETPPNIPGDENALTDSKRDDDVDIAVSLNSSEEERARLKSRMNYPLEGPLSKFSEVYKPVLGGGRSVWLFCLTVMACIFCLPMGVITAWSLCKAWKANASQDYPHAAFYKARVISTAQTSICLGTLIAVSIVLIIVVCSFINKGTRNHYATDNRVTRDAGGQFRNISSTTINIGQFRLP